MSSTIFALSSGSLPSAIAIFRLSGPKSLTVLKELSRKPVWTPKVMRFTRLYNEKGLIDEAMAVYLPGPKTFTGEDTTELFVHGSTAIATELAKSLESFEGVREAKRGEFTRRAFYNGKMSINEVRGLDRLIRSRTEKEKRMAFGQMRGGSKTLGIRRKLKEVLAKLFVVMDFGEHVDMQLEEAKIEILIILEDVNRMIRSWKGAEIAQRGLNIVLYGKPNSGKSSILNQLAHDDVAIVSPIAGTTRDSLETTIDINGIRCRLTDTAGIRRNTSDEVEKEGMKRARRRIEAADIVLIVVDPKTEQEELDEIWNDAKSTMNMESKIVVIRNKTDLNQSYPDIHPSANIINTSAIEPNGVDSLRCSLSQIVDEMCPETTYLLDASLLQKCSSELEMATTCYSSSDAAIMCSHVENALESIAELSSNVVAEDVLDEIFSSFCIGK